MSIEHIGMNKEQIHEGKPSVVILGSFRFMDDINELIETFESDGINVLAPGKGKVVKEDMGFRILDEDETNDPIELEAAFLKKMDQADVVYLMNQPKSKSGGGYIGFLAYSELMFCLIRGIPIYSMTKLDPMVEEDRQYQYVCDIIPTCSPVDMVERIKEKKLVPVHSPYLVSDLPQLTDTDAKRWAAFMLSLDGLRRVTKEGLPGKTYFNSLNKDPFQP